MRTRRRARPGLPGKIVEYAAVDQFAEDQAVIVENLGEHVGLLGWITPMQIAESMQDVPDASDDVAQSFLFEVDLAAELFFEGAPILVEAVDLREIVAMLVSPRAFVARVILPFLPERSRLGRGLGDVTIEGQNARGGAFLLDRAVLRRHGIEIGQAQSVDDLPEAV